MPRRAYSARDGDPTFDSIDPHDTWSDAISPSMSGYADAADRIDANGVEWVAVEWMFDARARDHVLLAATLADLEPHYQVTDRDGLVTVYVEVSSRDGINEVMGRIVHAIEDSRDDIAAVAWDLHFVASEHVD